MRPLLASLLAAVLLPGCLSATFTRTAGDYVPHAVDTAPEVFIDRLPARPYRPVGVIEVQSPAAASLSQVLAAARSKGKAVGCDVVVDRAIHRVGALPSRRWQVAVDLTPDAEERRPIAETSGPRNSLLGTVVTPAPQRFLPLAAANTAVIYNNTYAAPPPDKREFVCGIYEPAAAPDAAPAPAPVPAPPPATALR